MLDTHATTESLPTADDEGQQQVSIRSSKQGITRYDSLDDLPNSARMLLEEEGQRRFFNGLSWYKVFCRTCLDQGQQPAFYHLTSSDLDGGQVILPLVTPLGRSGCKVSDRQLGPNSGMSMTNYQSVHYGPITNQSGEALTRSLEQLARHLKAEGFRVLDFNHLDVAIPASTSMRPAFKRAGFTVHDYVDEPIVLEDIDGRNYETFMKDRSSKLRRNVGRLRRKLEQAGEVRFVMEAGGPNLAQAITDYEAVQKASWKDGETYRDHVPALIEAAADAGLLRLGLLYLNDRPVATDLTIISDGNVIGKKGHFDEEMRKHNVGDILTSYMFEHLIDTDRAKSIDFGKSAAPYKLKWVSQQRPMHGFVAFDPLTVNGQYWQLRMKATHTSRLLLSKIKSTIFSKSAS